MYRNFSASSVSRLMFSLRTPASLRGRASFGSSTPLVVMQTSRIPGTAAVRSQMETMFFFTSGSPPVMRSLLIPSSAAVSTARTISSSVSISLCSFLHTPSSGMQ